MKERVMAGNKQVYAALDTILDQYNDGLISITDIEGQFISLTMRFEPVCNCAQCRVIRAKERVNHPAGRGKAQ
jgi:hypothetical protein